MIIPLGLGFRTKRVPIITWAIIALCLLVYVVPRMSHSILETSPKDYERLYTQIPERITVERAHDHLFYEHCAKNFEIKDICHLFAIERGLYLERDDVPSFNGINVRVEKDFKPAEIMLRFSRFYEEFRNLLKKESKALTGLPSYGVFATAQTKLNEKIQDIREENNLLHKENLTIVSILVAMFSHESLAHLIGNMLFLFLFGRYVESRLGHVNYLFTYLILGGAALGIYARFAPEMYLQVMGASANVASIMGTFYGLFYHKKIRIFFFYLFYKSADLPVKTYMFLLFMLQEFVFTFTAQGNVAYMAHALGLSFGIVYGFAFRKLRPVPPQYLYREEMLDWEKAQKISKHAPFIQACLKILRYNPRNKKVLHALIDEILTHKKDLGDLPLEEELHLRRLIPIYLKDLEKTNDWDRFFDALDKIPHSWSLPHCLSRFNQKMILDSLDEAIDRGRLFPAIKLIQAFSERYQRSSKIYNLLKTLGSIVAHLELNEKNLGQLKKIKQLTSSRPLKQALTEV